MSKIYITQLDFDRLKNLLAKKKPHDEFDRALSRELDKAEIVESKNMPEDVITMNSQVRFIDEHDNEWRY